MSIEVKNGTDGLGLKMTCIGCGKFFSLSQKGQGFYWRGKTGQKKPHLKEPRR
jgi:hypothetical protein